MKKAINMRKDSMIKANELKQTLLKFNNKKRIDSIQKANDRFKDSIASIRKNFTDSIASINKYKNSKKYKDSITKNKNLRQAELQKERLARLDSIKIARDRYRDSLISVQKTRTDSIKTALNVRRDSLQNALAKSREKRLKSIETKTKENTTKLDTVKKKDLSVKAQLIAKHESKNEAYDNSQFLKKKWGFPRSVMQNTYTRYNYYYNANKKFTEMNNRIYKLEKKNYDTLISIYKINPSTAMLIAGSDPDSIIKKASLDIQMHDPRSKWQDNLFYLIAKSYYTKNDLDNTIPYLKYIIINYKNDIDKKGKINKNFVEKVKDKKGKTTKIFTLCTKEPSGLFSKFKHKPIRNDAIISLIRAYADEGYISDALSLCNILEIDPNFPKRLRSELYKVKTYIYINDKNFQTASSNLNLALKYTKKKSDKDRLFFLKGQLYEQNYKPDSAYINFKKILKTNPDFEMNLEARYKMANLVFENNWSNKNEEIKNILKRLLKDDKYSESKSTTLFYLGKMYALERNDMKAEEYFQKSVSDSLNNANRENALVQLVYYYFKQLRYRKAYEVFQQLQVLNSQNAIFDNFDYTNNIAKLANNEKNWIENDSLAKLVSFTEKEKRKWAELQYENYKKSLSNKAIDKGFESANKLSKPTNSTSNSNKKQSVNWYFTELNNMGSGKLAFQNRFKNIPNVDNWARSADINKSITDLNSSKTLNENTDDVKDQLDDSKKDENYFYNQIKNLNDKEFYNSESQKNIYNLGLINQLQLNKPKIALHFFDTLINLYPLTEYRPKIYFQNYLSFQKTGDNQKADYFKRKLDEEFPGTSTFYFKELNDSKNKIDSTEIYYSEMYDLYNNNDFINVIKIDSEKSMIFDSNPSYKIKSNLLTAQSYAGLTNYTASLSTLDLIQNETKTIEENEFYILFRQLIEEKLKLNNPKDSTTKDTVKEAMEMPPVEINQPINLVILLKNNEVLNEMKIKLTDYNTKFYSLKKLPVSEKYFSNKSSSIIISNFENWNEARTYLLTLGKRWDEEIKVLNFFEFEIFGINIKNSSYLNIPKFPNKYFEFFKGLKLL